MNIFYIFSLKLSNVFWMSVLSMAKTIDRLFSNKSIQSFDALFIYIQIQIMFLSLASGLFWFDAMLGQFSWKTNSSKGGCLSIPPPQIIAVLLWTMFTISSIFPNTSDRDLLFVKQVSNLLRENKRKNTQPT